MFGLKAERRKHGPRPLPRPRTLAIAAIGFFVGYVLVYLAVWETHPEWQTILNRISWCAADAVAITGTALAIYSYWLVYKASKDTDVGYLNEFVYAIKDAGIAPDDIKPWLATGKVMLEAMNDDPEFKDRMMKASERAAKDRIDCLKRLEPEELFEIMRSGGGKLL